MGEIRVAMTTCEIERANDLLVMYLGMAARAPVTDGTKAAAS